MYKVAGFTMIELVVVVAIMALTLSFAVPMFKTQIDQSRLKGAAETFFSMISLAKSEAIMRNKDIYVSLHSGANWCLGFTDKGSACDCSVLAGATQCLIDGMPKVLRAETFPNISIHSKYNVGAQDIPLNFYFDRVQAVSKATYGGIFNGTTTFYTPDNHYISSVLSSLGRARLCSNPNNANPVGVPGFVTRYCNITPMP